MFVDVYRERAGELGNVNFTEYLPRWFHEWIVLVTAFLRLGKCSGKRFSKTFVCSFEASQIFFA